MGTIILKTMKNIKAIIYFSFLVLFSIGCEITNYPTINYGCYCVPQGLHDIINVLGDTLILYQKDSTPFVLIKTDYQIKRLKQEDSDEITKYIWEEEKLNCTYQGDSLELEIKMDHFNYYWGKAANNIHFNFHFLNKKYIIEFSQLFYPEDKFLVDSYEITMYDLSNEYFDLNTNSYIYDTSYLEVSRETGIRSLKTSMGDSLYNYEELINIDTSN